MYAEWWRNAAVYEFQQAEQAKHPNAFVFIDTCINAYLYGKKAEEWVEKIGKKYGARHARPYYTEIDPNGEKVCTICGSDVWLNRAIKAAYNDGIEIVVVPYAYVSQAQERIESRAQEIFNEEILRRVGQ